MTTAEEGGTTPKKPKAPRAQRPDGVLQGPRPAVQLGPDLDGNVGAAMRGLAMDPGLYHRAGELVRVIPAGEDSGPAILPHPVETLRVQLSRFCYFTKWDRDRDSFQPCLPSDPVTKAIHKSPERWGALRPLAGVPEYPVLLPSGEVLDVEGYERTTHLLYLPSIDFGTVQAEPTHEECLGLLRFLWVELCYDFPFRGMGYPAPGAHVADPDGVLRFLEARERPDAWGLIVALFTLLARPAIAGDCPAIVFDATTPGSGKGLQIDIVCLIVFGRILGKLTYPKGGGMDADHSLEQMLGGEARSGALCVILDEILGSFGGPSINKVLTGGGKTKLRVLGVTETVEKPWRAPLLGAGNNIQVSDNTVRRVLVPRLEPPTEDPTKQRPRRHADLPAWVRAHRAELVRAALTILRGYVVAGRPQMGIDDWSGGFEGWTMVARAIKWAGGGDVMGCRPSVDPTARNEDAVKMEILLDTLERLNVPDGITISGLFDRLYTPDRLRGRTKEGADLAPDGFNDARDAINTITEAKGGRRPESEPLGKFFRVWKKRPIGDRQLQPLGTTHNAQRWGVAKAGS